MYRAVVGTSGLSNSHIGFLPIPSPKSTSRFSVQGSISFLLPFMNVITGVARSKKVAETCVMGKKKGCNKFLYEYTYHNKKYTTYAHNITYQ